MESETTAFFGPLALFQVVNTGFKFLRGRNSTLTNLATPAISWFSCKRFAKSRAGPATDWAIFSQHNASLIFTSSWVFCLSTCSPHFRAFSKRAVTSGMGSSPSPSMFSARYSLFFVQIFFVLFLIIISLNRFPSREHTFRYRFPCWDWKWTSPRCLLMLLDSLIITGKSEQEFSTNQKSRAPHWAPLVATEIGLTFDLCSPRRWSWLTESLATFVDSLLTQHQLSIKNSQPRELGNSREPCPVVNLKLQFRNP